MSVNVELLEKLYDWAVASQKSLDKFFEANPEFAKWNQGAWGEAVKNGTCQTAFCLAGQTAVMNGYTFVIEPDDWQELSDDDNLRLAQSSDMVPTSQVHALGGRFLRGSGKTFATFPPQAYAAIYGNENSPRRYPSSVAAEVLGIWDDEANRLFNGGNDVEDIEIIINEIFEVRDLPNRVGSGRTVYSG